MKIYLPSKYNKLFTPNRYLSRKRAAPCSEMLLTGIKITKTGRQSTDAKESTNIEFT